MTSPRWLERAARRGSERGWTLGAVLSEYCRIEGITRKELADSLACSQDTLSWLSLCRKPKPDRVADDVTTIADRFGIDASKLAQIIRHVDVLSVLRKRSTSEHAPLLLAARDHGEESKQ